MKAKGTIPALAFVLVTMLAATAAAQTISGDYVEFRTADVYTGPCFANGEVNLTGHEAVLAWRIERGSWRGVALDGLSVVAVVRASATLGDLYANPLPARTVFVVDERAGQAQRDALISFAQAQARGLLNDVIAVDVAPIRFQMDVDGRHGAARLEAGAVVRLATRPISAEDHFCANEEIHYPPLAANLHHSMPAVARTSAYTGNHLGRTWTEHGRRSSFVGTFSF
jgi:hypothetical protein